MNIEKAIDHIIDKSKWKTFRFDELAFNRVEKVVPKGSGLQHYIGLEHLDSGSVHIKRFGETESLIGDKLKIYTGDIIFAKRNAYLKRAAISPIDAVASAHSLVLRINEENVDKRFLPFFLMSEYFWERAIEISVGSLSPTINWKSLAKQEFLIPPKEQQAELAELLWAMDEVIQKDLVVLERLEEYRNYYIETFFSDLNDSLSKKKLKNIADINKYSLKNNTSDDYEFSYIDLSSIEKRKLIDTQKIKFKDSPSRARRIVKDNSILISTVRPYQLCNVFIEQNNNEYVASTGTAVINIHEGISPKLIFEQFFTNRYLNFIEDRMTGTNYPAITGKDLETYEVYMTNDNKVVDEFEKWSLLSNEVTLDIESKLSSSKSLQKSLINQIF